MSLNKYNLAGILSALMLSGLFSIDGLLSGIGVLRESGTLNVFLALFIATTCYTFALYQYKFAWRAIAKFKFFCITLCFIIFLFSIIISSFVFFEKLKVLRDAIYISTYFSIILTCCILLLKTYGKYFFKGFFSAYLLINLTVLPIIALLLGFFDSTEGRFEGIFGAATLNGNIAAMFGAFLILKGRTYYSALTCWFLICASIIIVFTAGTRSALLIIFAALCVLGLVSDYRKYFWTLGGGVSLLLFTFLINYQDQIAVLIEQTAFANRLVSADDVEGGSLATRINWYYTLGNRLVLDNLIGGFGAGSAESYLGYIPHFDFLKNYYDYSFAGGVVYLIFIILISTTGKTHFTIYSFFVYFMICFHNAFLVPVLMINWIILTVGAGVIEDKELAKKLPTKTC